MFTIVNTNAEANIPQNSILEPGYYLVENQYIRIDATPSEMTVDTELSTVSTNPVENRVVTSALNNK